ncbi:hypothetical protein [Agromyces sp. SYSU T00194]|uniref:hypothetical protein n=1 Tax=Agromyces chitinivorans TaxID=3158560 RepID=UPI00339557E5
MDTTANHRIRAAIGATVLVLAGAALTGCAGEATGGAGSEAAAPAAGSRATADALERRAQVADDCAQDALAAHPVVTADSAAHLIDDACR